MDLDLLCVESMETVSSESVAYADQVLLDDDRMLQNLLNSEDRYIPSSSYFDTVQRELTPDMRKIVADWMLEVSVELFVRLRLDFFFLFRESIFINAAR